MIFGTQVWGFGKKGFKGIRNKMGTKNFKKGSGTLFIFFYFFLFFFFFGSS